MDAQQNTFKPGDDLPASHVNWLTQAAKKVMGAGPGSFQSGSGLQNIPPVPFDQIPVQVTSVTNAPIYGVRPLVYTPNEDPDIEEEDKWAVESGSNQYDLDASVNGLTLEAGQKLNAYWHDTRGMFLPLVSSSSGVTSTSSAYDCPCGTCLQVGSIDTCGAVGSETLATDYSFRLTSANYIAHFGRTVVVTHTTGCVFESDIFEDVELQTNRFYDCYWELEFTGLARDEVVLKLWGLLVPNSSSASSQT